jgi:hypothetical protein
MTAAHLHVKHKTVLGGGGEATARTQLHTQSSDVYVGTNCHHSPRTTTHHATAAGARRDRRRTILRTRRNGPT